MLLGSCLVRHGDGELAGDACDSCTAVANPRVAADFLAANPWATLTGDQRDDDDHHDGYGNRCDAKFPGVSGVVVSSNDLVQFRASNGKGGGPRTHAARAARVGAGSSTSMRPAR